MIAAIYARKSTTTASLIILILISLLGLVGARGVAPAAVEGFLADADGGLIRIWETPDAARIGEVLIRKGHRDLARGMVCAVPHGTHAIGLAIGVDGGRGVTGTVANMSLVVVTKAEAAPGRASNAPSPQRGCKGYTLGFVADPR